MQFINDDLEAIFRQEVQEFIANNLQKNMAARQRRAADPSVDSDGLDWHRALCKRGWSVPHWPQEYGGCDWSPMQLYAFEEECHFADAPIPAWQNTRMVGPIIYTFGNDHQKNKFLPPIVQGDYQWAQGFSEPGSGSDLASLRTVAVREGDAYIVNGQKIWTSGAAHCEWGFFLVRTDTHVRKQAGISFLLIDLKSAGITIRTIPHMNGSEHLCEIFLEDVRVPITNRVGDEGEGWNFAKFLLNHERTASSFVFWSKRELQKVKEIAFNEKRAGVRLIDQPIFRNRLVKIECDLVSLEWSVRRILSKEKFPKSETAVASALKVQGAKLQQSITELGVDALGSKAVRSFDYERMINGDYPIDDVWKDYLLGKTSVYFSARAATIYGGSLQIQKDIIAKSGLNL